MTQLVIIGPAGRIDLSFVAAFESRQRTRSIRTLGIDGAPVDTEWPDGWAGSFELKRGTSAVDDFIESVKRGDRDDDTMWYYADKRDFSVPVDLYEGVTFKLGVGEISFHATHRWRV